METEAETGIGTCELRRMPEQEIFITVSDALEYLFCPRFIFFMHCLGIAQQRGAALQGLEGQRAARDPGEGEPGLREKEAKLHGKRDLGLSDFAQVPLQGRGGRGSLSGRRNGCASGLQVCRV